MNDETIKSLTDNEIEFMEILRTAENPEEAVKIAFEILKQMLDENSITSKLLKLIMGRYSSIAEFAKAIKMSEEATADIINGRAEPTLDEVIIIAKALNKEPEEIAEIFIDHHSKQKTTTPNQKENLHFNDYVKKTKKGSKEKCRLRIGDLTAKMRL